MEASGSIPAFGEARTTVGDGLETEMPAGFPDRESPWDSRSFLVQDVAGSLLA